MRSTLYFDGCQLILLLFFLLVKTFTRLVRKQRFRCRGLFGFSPSWCFAKREKGKSFSETGHFPFSDKNLLGNGGRGGGASIEVYPLEKAGLSLLKTKS
jgi:hypothetical protein